MDLHKIKALLDYVGRSRVAEMRVTQDGTTVVIRNAPAKADGMPLDVSANSSPAASASAAPLSEGPEAGHSVVRSPVSGIVHKAANPGAPALAQAGMKVDVGQGLCVLEAMKVFTTVPAPVAGTIGRILFEDGQEVAAGDPLLEIG